MSEPTFTPGPWATDGHMIDALDGDRITIASVNRVWRGEGIQSGNANLIASAPDMYAALRRLVAFGCGYGPPEVVRAWNKAVEDATKVLIRVGGES